MSDQGVDLALDDVPAETLADPQAPVPQVLDPDDPLTVLRQRVIETLQALPSYFQLETSIEGVHATDLQSANTLLGASIEVQVVLTLNRLREMWDPDKEWLGYRFERQSQTFPDVRLVRRRGADVDIAMGIELKGWYLFSKEAVPTFRFVATSAACASHDLLCVVPWHFSNVTSGTPVARDPWVVPARWAAEYRNYWWTHVKDSTASKEIVIPSGVSPYPTKDQQISDVPIAPDKGKNFGRLARVAGLMGAFVRDSLSQEALGIQIRDWVTFFARHKDSADPDSVYSAIAAQLATHQDGIVRSKAERIATLLYEILEEMGE